MNGNLSVSHEVFPLPAVKDSLPLPPIAEDPSPSHWLVFRATKRIEEGEPMYVITDTVITPKPIFESAQVSTGVSKMCLYDPSEAEEAFVLDEAPRSVRRPTNGAVALGASRVHGAGVFATRDIAAGEIVEVVPMLPISYKDICLCMLRDYAFESDFDAGTEKATKKAAIVMMPLGLGGLYNHTESGANIYPRRVADQPFIQAWAAQVDIAAGSELFVGYGGAYWDAPWRGHTADAAGPRRPVAPAEPAWWERRWGCSSQGPIEHCARIEPH